MSSIPGFCGYCLSLKRTDKIGWCGEAYQLCDSCQDILSWKVFLQRTKQGKYTEQKQMKTKYDQIEELNRLVESLDRMVKVKSDIQFNNDANEKQSVLELNDIKVMIPRNFHRETTIAALADNIQASLESYIKPIKEAAKAKIIELVNS